jgi:predicted permease
VTAFLSQAGGLFVSVLLPILLLIGCGALVQRYHPLDMNTLSKLQIYLLVPVFLFVRVFDSTLGGGQIAGVVGAVLLAKLLLAVPLLLLLRRLRVKRETLGVVLLSAAVFNAGNFGIPVAERAYGAAGGAVQALVVMVSNLTMWGVGYTLMAAVSGGGVGRAILAYFKLPMVYLLVAAFALRGLHVRLPSPVSYSLHLLADCLVPLALLTLGAQLMRQARWPNWRRVAPVLVLKLVALPLVMTGVVLAFGMWPWPGAQLILAAAGPSAVNTILLTIEQGGDTELAAECVFWTTLLSAVTVTITLTLLRLYGGAPPVT